MKTNVSGGVCCVPNVKTILLVKIMDGGVTHEGKRVDGAAFSELYNDADVRADLDRRWRDKANSRRHGQVISGKHEWLPTNMFPYILKYALRHQDIRWIVAMEILRTPTRNLIYRQRKINTDGATAVEVLGMNGHVGALYTAEGACTVGMAGWHDKSRRFLTDNLNNDNNDLDAYLSALNTFIGRTVWSGDLNQLGNFDRAQADFLQRNAARIPCDYHKDRRGTNWVTGKPRPSLNDMAVQQKVEYGLFTTILHRLFVVLKTMDIPQTDPVDVAGVDDSPVGLPDDIDYPA